MIVNRKRIIVQLVQNRFVKRTLTSVHENCVKKDHHNHRNANLKQQFHKISQL